MTLYMRLKTKTKNNDLSEPKPKNNDLKKPKPNRMIKNYLKKQKPKTMIFQTRENILSYHHSI